MSIADAFAAPRSSTPASKCKLALTLNAMDPRDAHAVELALSSEQWSASQIGRTLRANGVTIGDSIIKLHRRGDCCCKAAS